MRGSSSAGPSPETETGSVSLHLGRESVRGGLSTDNPHLVSITDTSASPFALFRLTGPLANGLQEGRHPRSTMRDRQVRRSTRCVQHHPIIVPPARFNATAADIMRLLAAAVTAHNQINAQRLWLTC
jgi:hypothetical protein